jgi:DNA-binding CsgD family transcriptional regulator
VLTGPSGVGKTRLARESLTLSGPMGFVPLVVTANRATVNLPFGAIAPLLPSADRAEGADGPRDLLRRSAAAILEHAGGGRLALLVDDAHLLDRASAQLLGLLARSGQAFLIVTVRTGEPAPGAVGALWKEHGLDRLEVPALNEDAMEVLVPEALRGPVDPGTIAGLAARAMGNALFLRELLIGALDSGALVDVGGLWRLVGPLSPSERLVELVENRLRGLDPDERRFLEIVAYAEQLGAGEVAGSGDGDVAEALNRTGILARRLNGRRVEYHLVHPMFGEVLRQQAPAIRVRKIARSLADAVDGAGARRREDLLRVATWRLDGGGGEPARLLAAAATARWRYDFRLAERLARAAVDAGAGFAAALLAAQLAALQGRSADAEAQLAKLAAAAGTDAERGDVAINRLDNLVFHQGRLDQALRIIESAEADITDPRWRDEIAARRRALLLATRGPRAYADLDESLLDEPPGRALVWACIFRAYALARLGWVDSALDVTSRGLAAHQSLTQPLDWDPCLHVYFRCDALAYAGFFHEAESLASAQYHQGLREGNLDAQAYFALHLGKTVAERGHIAGALGRLREAVALFSQLGRPLMVHVCLIYLAMAEALGGDAEAAHRTLLRRDDLGVDESMYVTVDALQARAWTEVAAGDIPAARQRLEQSAALGEEIGDLVGQASALHGLARLGHAKRVAGNLRALAAAMEGRLVSLRAAHAEAAAGGDADALKTVATDFEELGAHLLAAEAAADAAVVARRAGDGRRAAAAQQEVARLRLRCEGALTPALQAVEGRARLTRAEREVALLAAAGHTNPEIAEKLALSVRTVANHLQHAYEKLDIHQRSALREALDTSR